MREWCLVNATGNVINMCMNYGPGEPWISDYQISRGYTWKPRSDVSQSDLSKYKYWDERP